MIKKREGGPREGKRGEKTEKEWAGRRGGGKRRSKTEKKTCAVMKRAKKTAGRSSDQGVKSKDRRCGVKIEHTPRTTAEETPELNKMEGEHGEDEEG